MMTDAGLVSIDTNILVYAEGAGDEPKRQISTGLLTRLNQTGYILPVQAAGEFLRVMRRKMHVDAMTALGRLDELSINATLAQTTESAFLNAREIMMLHGLDIWDCIMLAASHAEGSRLFLSEDMQDGFVWRGLTIANPFSSEPHPLLQSYLNISP
jgi:predicted nucleic acid-binding protein